MNFVTAARSVDLLLETGAARVAPPGESPARPQPAEPAVRS